MTGMDIAEMSKARDRKNLRTALLVGLIAVATFATFVYKVWQFG